MSLLEIPLLKTKGSCWAVEFLIMIDRKVVVFFVVVVFFPPENRMALTVMPTIIEMRVRLMHSY